MKKCGFITVLGETNAGKSTLINKLVGQKVSIVSRKQQTTLFRINGIAVCEDSQIIFVDTPGFLRRKIDSSSSNVPIKKADNLERIAWGAFRETELVMFVVDANKKDMSNTIELLKKIDDSKKVILVLNKIDLIQKSKLLELIDKLKETHAFVDIFMISALKNDGVSQLKKYLAGLMPEHEWLYSDDEATDQPFETYVSEITREQLYDKVHQEVPYKCNVITRSYEQVSDNHIVIYQDIHVKLNSHKIIIVGHNGNKIKEIGTSARRELSRLLGCKISLYLKVVVDDNKQ